MRRLLLGFGVLVAAVWTLSGCGGGGGAPVVQDTTPPSISGLQTRYEGDLLVVQAEIVDTGTGVKRAWVVRRGLNANQSEVEMQPVSGTNTYRATIGEVTARVQVRARDGAGNEAQTDETRVPPPPAPF